MQLFAGFVGFIGLMTLIMSAFHRKLSTDPEDEGDELYQRALRLDTRDNHKKYLNNWETKLNRWSR